MAMGTTSVDASDRQSTPAGHRRPAEYSAVGVAFDPAVTEYPAGGQFPYGAEDSEVYGLVRSALSCLPGGDPDSPLGAVVSPGDTVVVKPNFCSLANYPYPITHPSLLTPIIELAFKAGASRVVVAESPIDYQHGIQLFRSNYTNVVELVERLRSMCAGMPVEFVDTGYDKFTWVRLGAESELHPTYSGRNLYHPDFRPVGEDVFYYATDSQGTNLGGYVVGAYAIANTYLECDCLISVPKLKTHNQTGITCALKNMMGINKSFMAKELPQSIRRQLPADWREAPHSRDVPHFGLTGENFKECMSDPAMARRLLNYDNDVLWRSLADLNKIVQYVDAGGTLRAERQRKTLTVVDAVVAGEGEGPIGVTPKSVGAVFAGRDPVSVDAVCLHAMGWDPDSIPLVAQCGSVLNRHIGTIVPLEQCLHGTDPASALFRNFFTPTHTFSDEVIAPHSVRGRS